MTANKQDKILIIKKDEKVSLKEFILKKFKRRECVKFVPTADNTNK
jgi:hypothetical protein